MNNGEKTTNGFQRQTTYYRCRLINYLFSLLQTTRLSCDAEMEKKINCPFNVCDWIWKWLEIHLNVFYNFLPLLESVQMRLIAVNMMDLLLIAFRFFLYCGACCVCLSFFWYRMGPFKWVLLASQHKIDGHPSLLLELVATNPDKSNIHNTIQMQTINQINSGSAFFQSML